ncbi:MAG: 1-deoxy-D-xylulose-5-phosphate synthase [Capsulimonadaceae bacterium]|nr:1-deoxy-D-xylulose-5-phosphate synthase [Capsulimonadaceae bacterium]
MSESAALLPLINSPDDLKPLNTDQLKQLASEIRQYLVDCVSKTGGHLAPSLGVVELTLALHKVYNVPRDKVIWDVGHQGYVHKILTGRRDQLHSIRQYNGISGFLRIDESPYDIYGAGHASTAISAALGFAKARDFRGSSESVVALVGDGALTGGMAFEGLNNAAETRTDITIVLNDNEMSIAENVGAMATYLAKLRMQPTYQRAELAAKGMVGKLPVYSELAYKAARGVKHAATHWATPMHKGLLFEEMGLTYIGPIDGHDIKTLLDVFSHVRRLKGPCLVHVLTVKGKGLPYAEADSRRYHGVSRFSPDDGLIEAKGGTTTYTSVFSEVLNEAAEIDDKIVAITAAMPDGTGLSRFAKEHPARFFDVGIAEQHAVVFAAGLAASGMKPVCAVYSTFLQRAFDAIVHDVALQNLPVRIFVDRAGLVGEDGGTHHGAFDLSYLRCIPGLVVMAPRDPGEMKAMTRFALSYQAGPIAIRYPRGGGAILSDDIQPIEIGHAEVLNEEGQDVALIGIGDGVALAVNAAKLLAERGIASTVVNARFCKPLDAQTIGRLARGCKAVATIEDNVIDGGFGSAVAELLEDQDIQTPLVRFGLPDRFVEHGTVPVLRDQVGLSAQNIASRMAAKIGKPFSPALKPVAVA